MISYDNIWMVLMENRWKITIFSIESKQIFSQLSTFKKHCENTHKKNPCILYQESDIVYRVIFFQRISAFKTWLKNPKNRKLKLCLLFGLNVFFNVLTFIRINYQCSKLNTYLVIVFLSEWVYSVYIEIPLRLSPAPTFRALKKIWAQWCYIFLCTFVNREWLDQLTLWI